jgi:hypothetical protein
MNQEGRRVVNGEILRIGKKKMKYRSEKTIYLYLSTGLDIFSQALFPSHCSFPPISRIKSGVVGFKPFRVIYKHFEDLIKRSNCCPQPEEHFFASQIQLKKV